MDVTVFGIMLAITIFLGFIPLLLRKSIFAVLSFFGGILGIYTASTLGGDGSLTTGYLNNAGTIVPVNVSSSPIILVPIILTLVCFAITTYVAVKGQR